MLRCYCSLPISAITFDTVRGLQNSSRTAFTALINTGAAYFPWREILYRAWICLDGSPFPSPAILAQPLPVMVPREKMSNDSIGDNGDERMVGETRRSPQPGIIPRPRPQS
jgi:hypothetical protein